MENKLRASRRFQQSYRKKTPEQQQAIAAALTRMQTSIDHASLRVRKIQGHDNIWEARAGLSLRITFTRDDGGLYLRTNCSHDQVYRSP